MQRKSNIGHKYNLIIDNSREIIIFFQRNGLITDCNKAAKDILEYGDDILNTYISDIFREAVSLKDDCLVVGPKFMNTANETTAYKMDKTSIYVDLKLIIKEDRESFIGLCLASDITLQKKLVSKVKHVRSDMKKLLQLKNRAVANIIHELRTPVSGIMGMSEILMDMDLSPEQSDNVNIIYKSSKCLNALINDLFDIVRMKNSKPILKEDGFNIYQMIDKIIKIYRFNIREKQLKLIVNMAEDIPAYLIGDEFRLAQIIENLLSNAIKFTHNGEVELNVSMTSYKNDEAELLFQVTDTGIGIDDEDLEKIFMSYYQVDGSIRKCYEGVGLGLTISQMLAKAMGGRISVKSTMGKGSTFSFSVSLKKAHIYKEEKADSSLTVDTHDRMVMTREYDYSIIKDYSDSHIDDKILIEKLKATIEEEDWQYAERLALRMRELILNEDKIIANKMLQLLFSIRKEERELSIKRIEELIEIKNMHP